MNILDNINNLIEERRVSQRLRATGNKNPAHFSRKAKARLNSYTRNALRSNASLKDRLKNYKDLKRNELTSLSDKAVSDMKNYKHGTTRQDIPLADRLTAHKANNKKGFFKKLLRTKSKLTKYDKSTDKGMFKSEKEYLRGITRGNVRLLNKLRKDPRIKDIKYSRNSSIDKPEVTQQSGKGDGYFNLNTNPRASAFDINFGKSRKDPHTGFDPNAKSMMAMATDYQKKEWATDYKKDYDRTSKFDYIRDIPIHKRHEIDEMRELVAKTPKGKLAKMPNAMRIRRGKNIIDTGHVSPAVVWREKKTLMPINRLYGTNKYFKDYRKGAKEYDIPEMSRKKMMKKSVFDIKEVISVLRENRYK
jgi:hypothetical protein